MMKKWWILLIGMLLLTGCNVAWSATETPEPTLPPVKADANSIAVEGVVEPARWVTLYAGDSSVIIEVAVAEKDTIQAGDILLKLDDADIQAAIAQAESALAGVQAQLALVKADARPEQVAVLEAQLAAASAVISQTQALLDARLAHPIEAEVAEAQAAIADAEVAIRRADKAHDDTMECFEIPKGSRTETICPALGTFEEMARMQIEATQATLAAAQAQAAAIHGPVAAQVAVARSSVQTALAQRDTMQAHLDLMRAGATTEAIATAEAAVRQAKAVLANTRALLETRVYDAPFAATITGVTVHPGDTPQPGAPLITLATLDQLQIRTKNLTELDIARVAEGQSVLVTFDALPDAVFTGHVTRVERQSVDYLGDVVYPVYIELDETPAWIRWGMTANCELQIGAAAHQRSSTSAKQQNSETGNRPPHIFAEAIIEPERTTDLRFTIGGEIAEVWVKPGMEVQAGDVIARLDTTRMEAAVREAEARLATAQAQLAQAKAGARPEEIAAAEAQIAEAEGEVAQAVALRDTLTGGTREAEIAAVQAELESAQAEKRSLEASLQWIVDKDPRNDDDAKQERNLRQEVAAMELRIQAAQTRLNAIPLTSAGQIRAANAAILAAEARRDAALADLALLQAGPRPEDIAIVETGVQQAQAALTAAQITLARAEIYAPFDGTITQVHIEIGEQVGPEHAIAVLATLDQLQARTQDLLETDIIYVNAGQSVNLKVDALPEQTFQGHVTQVEAQSTLYRGDVTYPVIITFDGDTSGLLWGMKSVMEIGE
ncbi:MAG: HlyD family efflux transporter periplasmic adaptor subunit [Anaerolineae bacterium]|nr:HlyD family efflux transporter periplasmic adaptor subunit [Anaerolineae bacterium]